MADGAWRTSMFAIVNELIDFGKYLACQIMTIRLRSMVREGPSWRSSWVSALRAFGAWPPSCR
ncbi:hypothetical protein BRAS3843_3150001 [Bradyrhizobium sp. STM 3843]|nr:hypothetical protein BRAS3843_3150001 [Bradyrhizobium sp. STM 3843]